MFSGIIFYGGEQTAENYNNPLSESPPQYSVVFPSLGANHTTVPPSGHEHTVPGMPLASNCGSGWSRQNCAAHPAQQHRYSWSYDASEWSRNGLSDRWL